MNNKIISVLLGPIVLCCLIGISTSAVQSDSQEKYQCTPCGQDCDNIVHHKPGTCTDCNMPLVKKSAVHFRTIHPDTLCRYIQQHPDIILLDVRTQAEFEGSSGSYGSLNNAINVPIQELDQKISSLENYKNKEIIVYCSHSHRSPRASFMLSQHGFKKVTNMAGGMSTMKDGACMR